MTTSSSRSSPSGTAIRTGTRAPTLWRTVSGRKPPPEPWRLSLCPAGTPTCSSTTIRNASARASARTPGASRSPSDASTRTTSSPMPSRCHASETTRGGRWSRDWERSDDRTTLGIGCADLAASPLICRVYIATTEQSLDRPDVLTTLEKMGRQGVLQHMRADRLSDLGTGGRALNRRTERALVEVVRPADAASRVGRLVVAREYPG